MGRGLNSFPAGLGGGRGGGAGGLGAEELTAIIKVFAPGCPVGSVLVPQGAFSVPKGVLRGLSRTIFDPVIEIREHHWTQKLDFEGSKTHVARF